MVQGSICAPWISKNRLVLTAVQNLQKRVCTKEWGDGNVGDMHMLEASRLTQPCSPSEGLPLVVLVVRTLEMAVTLTQDWSRLPLLREQCFSALTDNLSNETGIRNLAGLKAATI